MDGYEKEKLPNLTDGEGKIFMEDLGEWAQQTLIDVALPTAESDKEIAALFTMGEEIVKLQSGNICRTLGGKQLGHSATSSVGTICSVDLGFIKFEEKTIYFASHCSIRRHRFSTKGVLVMNAQWYKNRRVAIRAHPSDGKLDLIYSNLNLRQYCLAAKRSESGNHMPHPDIRTQSIRSHIMPFPRPMQIYADGSLVGKALKIEIGIAHRVIKVVVH